MFRRSLLLLVCLCLIPTFADALCTNDPDEIAIFFSEDCDACVNCITAPSGILLSAHVVLLNSSAPEGVWAFEFSLVNADGTPMNSAGPPAGFAAEWELPPDAISFLDPPHFQVGMQDPLPWAPCIELLRFSFISFTGQPWCFGVKPLAPEFAPTIPGQMMYMTDFTLASAVPMYPATGPDTGDYAMACYNSGPCEAPVAVAEKTWDAVKSLYR